MIVTDEMLEKAVRAVHETNLIRLLCVEADPFSVSVDEAKRVAADEFPTIDRSAPIFTNTRAGLEAVLGDL